MRAPLLFGLLLSLALACAEGDGAAGADATPDLTPEVADTTPDAADAADAADLPLDVPDAPHAADTAPDTADATPDAPDTAPGPVDCDALACRATCATDEDCDLGQLCVGYAQGCCTACMPRCDDDCYLEAGTYCPENAGDDACVLADIALDEVGPCAFELVATGEDGRVDRLLVDGCGPFVLNLPETGCSAELDADTRELLVACNWCGRFAYAPAFCGCQPDCEGRECGPDGCGGSCGSCEVGCSCSSAGQCLGCGGEPEVPLTPACVHVPTLVGAGGVIPVAIYGRPGCDRFERVEIEQDTQAGATRYTLRVVGVSSLTGVCEPLGSCPDDGTHRWSYLGLVPLAAPTPGAYEVKVVGEDGTHAVIASGGDIEEPACLGVCAGLAPTAWDWTFLGVTGEALANQCHGPGSTGWLGTPLTFEGSCQSFTVQATNWPWSPNAFICTGGGALTFGDEAPHWTEATICPAPTGSGAPALLLGVTQGAGGGVDAPLLFVMEGTPAAP